MSKQLLMIFVKNPVHGRVKTRLAASVGEDAALLVYKHLLQHTRQITDAQESADKAVFYADEVHDNDLWHGEAFEKHLQEGDGLGTRMRHAFVKGFDQGYASVVIIGSDCAELQTEHLQRAFKELEHNDVVVGPSTDGGYYLLGMNRMHEPLFQHKQWSTDSVLSATLADLDREGLSYALLPELTDIDHEEDLNDKLKALITTKES